LFNWLLSSSPVIALAQQLLIRRGHAVNVYLQVVLNLHGLTFCQSTGVL
jgi:hypothetical protein